MTVQPDPIAFQIQPDHLFAGERSDWLDCFSRLEVAVLRCEVVFTPAVSPSTKPLGQRLTALKGVSASPRVSNDTLKALRERVRECEELLPLRASIVHAVMQTGRLGDNEVAFFQNSLDAARGSTTYLVLKQEDFIQSRHAMDLLAAGFEALATTSSRPRPERAAAAGP